MLLRKFFELNKELLIVWELIETKTSKINFRRYIDY